jgi:hypothetical protein
MVRYNDETFEILEEDDEWFKLIKVKNKNATWYNIPEYINFIESQAFRECINLETITIPENVQVIGEGAFYDCLRLNSVSFEGNKIETFDNYTFAGCNLLETINIPENLQYIDDYVFKDCFSLTSVKIPYNVSYLGFGAFMDCRYLISIYISSKTDIIGNEDIIDMDEQVELHASFENCSSLEIVHLMLPTNKEIHFKKTTEIDSNGNEKIIILYSPYKINKKIETNIRKIFDVENEGEFRYYSRESTTQSFSYTSVLPEHIVEISRYDGYKKSRKRKSRKRKSTKNRNT